MEETPPNPPPPPLAVSISLFFKTRTTNTHNHKKQPHPLAAPKMASKGGRGQPGLAGRESGQEEEENLVLCRVCASHSSRRWAGARLAPPATATAMAGTVGTGRALREGAGTEFRTMVHIMQYPRWAPRGVKGWTPHPPAPGTGGMAPTLGGEVGLVGRGRQAGSWQTGAQ